MTVGEPEEPGPIQQLLLEQARLISTLRSDLDELTSEFADTIASLTDRLDDGDTGLGGPGPRAWCWRQLGRRADEELWTQLHEWTNWVRHRYPLAKRIPGCWSEHPEIVEELTALWLAWQQAYETNDATLTAPAEWHDRWLPGFLYRLEHGPFALNCTQAHDPRPKHLYAALAPTVQTSESVSREPD